MALFALFDFADVPGVEASAPNVGEAPPRRRTCLARTSKGETERDRPMLHAAERAQLYLAVVHLGNDKSHGLSGFCAFDPGVERILQITFLNGT